MKELLGNMTSRGAVPDGVQGEVPPRRQRPVVSDLQAGDDTESTGGGDQEDASGEIRDGEAADTDEAEARSVDAADVPVVAVKLEIPHVGQSVAIMDDAGITVGTGVVRMNKKGQRGVGFILKEGYLAVEEVKMKEAAKKCMFWCNQTVCGTTVYKQHSSYVLYDYRDKLASEAGLLVVPLKNVFPLGV